MALGFTEKENSICVWGGLLVGWRRGGVRQFSVVTNSHFLLLPSLPGARTSLVLQKKGKKKYVIKILYLWDIGGEKSFFLPLSLRRKFWVAEE